MRKIIGAGEGTSEGGQHFLHVDSADWRADWGVARIHEGSGKSDHADLPIPVLRTSLKALD